MTPEELEAQRLAEEAEATNPIMQPTDLIGQQGQQETGTDTNPLLMGGLGLGGGFVASQGEDPAAAPAVQSPVEMATPASVARLTTLPGDGVYDQYDAGIGQLSAGSPMASLIEDLPGNSFYNPLAAGMAKVELSRRERENAQAPQAATNTMMQPTDLMGQQGQQETGINTNPLALAGLGGAAAFQGMFPSDSNQQSSETKISTFGLGMGVENQPYVANTDSGIQRGPSNDLLGMDEITKVTDNLSEQMGVPMTGMRPLNPETGQPASQMLIDAALRSGVALPQASVPINAVQTPQPQATNQPSTYPLDVTVGGQQIPTTPQPAAGSPQALFEQYRAEGPLSQEQIARGEAKALSMGTTFDPDTGFSRDNFLLGQQVPSMPQAPMGVEETRARLGGRTLNQYLNAPDGTEGVYGLRTDPQGRMIPSRGRAAQDSVFAYDAMTRADAYPQYEQEVSEAYDRQTQGIQQRAAQQGQSPSMAAIGSALPGSEFNQAQASQNVPTDVRQALNTPANMRTRDQQSRLAQWEGSTQGRQMGGVAGYERSKESVDPQKQEYDALRIEKLGLEISDLRKGEPSEVAQAESQADQMGLTGEDRQSFIIGKVAGPGAVDRILGKSPTDTKVPTSLIEAKEQRVQLAEARKLYAAGKINEAADILTSIGMINKLTGFPIAPSEYFKDVTPTPPDGGTGSKEPIAEVIARNLKQ